MKLGLLSQIPLRLSSLTAYSLHAITLLGFMISYTCTAENFFYALYLSLRGVLSGTSRTCFAVVTNVSLREARRRAVYDRHSAYVTHQFEAIISARGFGLFNSRSNFWLSTSLVSVPDTPFLCLYNVIFKTLCVGHIHSLDLPSQLFLAHYGPSDIVQLVRYNLQL